MSVLITLLIVILILGAVVYLITMLPLPEPWRTIAIVLVVLICIVYLLGMLPGVPHLTWGS